MAHFAYTAEKSDGEIYKGVAEAPDRFELYQIVRREGGHILSVSEDSRGGIFSFSYWNARFGSVPEYEKVLFARNLGAMIGAGLPLARSLAVLERQTKNAKLSRVISEVASEVRRGETLHGALGKYGDVFPRLFVAMVRAGEEGGELSGSLTVVSDQMERMYTLKKKIRGAMIYPAVIVVAIFGIGAMMMTQVVPTLAATFKEMDAELPHSTELVIAFSDFLTEHALLAALLFLGAGLSMYALLKTKAGMRGRDWAFVKMPLIGKITREVNAARTARTLASLLSSGVDMLTAIEITGEVVQNSYFREVLAEARGGVARGETLSSIFARREDLYPAFVGEMAAVGEETGALTEMMKRLAVFYEEEVDRSTKDMSTIIEPFLMVVIGGAVGFFAVSMIAPIYSLSENI